LKTGPIILVVLGVVLTLALFFSPVKSKPAETALANTAQETEEDHSDHNHSPKENDQVDPSASAVDAQIDSLLMKMRNQELPPMQAVLAIRDIAEKHPKNLKANFTLGLMSIQTGQFEKAVERFKTVVEVDPQNSEAYRLMAQCFANLGNLKSAEENYLKAIEYAAEQDKAGLKAELEKFNNNK
jgi:Flp pilus assembly protein TadD